MQKVVMMSVIASLQIVRKRISESGKKFHLQNICNTEIIAVSKTRTIEEILPLLEFSIGEGGCRIFGENRIQEAKSKWPELKKCFPDIELHLIGPLQTNKVKEAINLFDVIQTVDREKLAKNLATEMEKTEKYLDCFIQVNTGEEEQKAGILPNDADEFIAFCMKDLRLQVKGLMCIPPISEEAVLHFALLKKIAMRNELSGLSMGMSSDYEVAAALGATYVRVGTEIFGKRV